MDSGTEIIWRDEAKEDFRDALQYLSRSSLRYTEQWVDELNRKLTLLATFPEMGRIVPEKNTSFFREILVGKYRVLYIYLQKTITIVAIRHSASDVDRIQ
ncbi:MULTISPECIES: type II toxin-antitoxin system RelE/ParE family toxin [Larkinella]|uniref:Type II toxin-antitoxin system RelE/ParE family toxin n=1 Tax=Larkinella punicea TaxID=2315727 RepID=A0A368JZN9_9BACT|nr:type II toxin-antitoxin system RelE/ParE family toxin [Larkinella punicea]RCR71661.1 type II toxin-antitoxin system RelE/ParE family toxin [Larkinella punicea]